MPHSSSLPSPATDSWVQSGDSSLNSSAQLVAELPEDSIIGIRSKCPRFRILVIGRANAGKTTLLKRVCNSVEEPKIYDEVDEGLSSSLVYLCSSDDFQRGEHNIENQMIFKSNPGFIFHDSRGFESGALEESEKAKNFIKTRAASSSLAQQLHAIWYCLPMADTTRPILKTDEEFFDLEVPVIAIFTKCDGLFTEVRGALLAGGMDSNELNTKCIEKVGEILTTRFTALQQLRFAPAAHVNTQAFAATQDECVKKLVQVTAGALTNEALQLLFVSVQRNNLDLCAFYAVRRFVLAIAH
ncbi:GTP-binding protein [Mycena rebaudengoi]|nr:GTP-binding protein [Mycena rebaudengoi]